MTRNEDAELFDQLSRTKLRDWVQRKLDAEIKVLVANPDIELVRKAQGRAQLLQEMAGLMAPRDPAASKRI